MGFLDNLLKSGTRKIISNVVDSVADTVSDTITSQLPSKSDSRDTAFTRHQGARQWQTRSGEPTDEQSVRARLENIVARDWPGYELRKNVPASEFQAESGARNYSYGLYLNGQPKAMFMILTNRNHYQRSDVYKADSACQRSGIPYMNFMTHLPNTSEYIAQRLKTNISV